MKLYYVAQFLLGQMGEFGERLPVTHGTPVYLVADVEALEQQQQALLATHLDQNRQIVDLTSQLATMYTKVDTEALCEITRAAVAKVYEGKLAQVKEALRRCMPPPRSRAAGATGGQQGGVMETPRTKAGDLTEQIMAQVVVNIEDRDVAKLTTLQYNAIYEAVLGTLDTVQPLKEEMPCAPDLTIP